MSAAEFGAAAFLGGSPGGGELLLVFVVFLLLFGAKKLPEIARTIGRALEEFRRSARQVRDEVINAADPDAPAPLPPLPANPKGAPTQSAAPPPDDTTPYEPAASPKAAPPEPPSSEDL